MLRVINIATRRLDIFSKNHQNSRSVKDFIKSQQKQSQAGFSGADSGLCCNFVEQL
jgi:hypothetical protein